MKLKCLVDSGAARNLCSEKVANSLKSIASISYDKMPNLKGITGAKLHVKGTLKQVPIRIGKNQLNTDLHIVPALGEECILGLDFLESHQMIIDLEHLKLKNKHCEQDLHHQNFKRGEWKVKLIEQEDVSPGPFQLNCKVQMEDKEAEIPEGMFLIKPNGEIWGEQEENGKKWAVVIKDGECIIPGLNDMEEACLSLPKDTTIATIENLTVAINKVESEPEKDREEKIIEASKIREAKNLSDNQIRKVEELLREFSDIFALDRSELGVTPLIEHEIILKDNIPVQAPYRQVPFHVFKELQTEVQELLDAGVIEYSKSNYSSPAFLLRKGDKRRLIVDRKKGMSPL